MGSSSGALSPQWLVCLGLQDVESILCSQVDEATALSCPKEGAREASPHILPWSLTLFHALPPHRYPSFYTARTQGHERGTRPPWPSRQAWPPWAPWCNGNPW